MGAVQQENTSQEPDTLYKQVHLVHDLHPSNPVWLESSPE